MTTTQPQECLSFEDQLINAADFLYRHNMGFATQDQQYQILIKNGFSDDVAVIAIEDFGDSNE